MKTNKVLCNALTLLLIGLAIVGRYKNFDLIVISMLLIPIVVCFLDRLPMFLRNKDLVSNSKRYTFAFNIAVCITFMLTAYSYVDNITSYDKTYITREIERVTDGEMSVSSLAPHEFYFSGLLGFQSYYAGEQLGPLLSAVIASKESSSEVVVADIEFNNLDKLLEIEEYVGTNPDIQLYYNTFTQFTDNLLNFKRFEDVHTLTGIVENIGQLSEDIAHDTIKAYVNLIVLWLSYWYTLDFILKCVICRKYRLELYSTN